MARIIDCPRGHVLIGEDDEELFRSREPMSTRTTRR